MSEALNGIFYWTGVIVWGLILIGVTLGGYFSLGSLIEDIKEERRPKLEVKNGEIQRGDGIEANSIYADTGLPDVGGEKD